MGEGRVYAVFKAKRTAYAKTQRYRSVMELTEKDEKVLRSY